jgi:RNA polymerase sigma-70 factor (ECF subfamily)
MSTIVECLPFSTPRAVAQAFDRKRSAVARVAVTPRVDVSAADEALVHAIGRGDRSAVRILFNRYQTRVYRFILRMVRDQTLAEDVLSDVFLDVWVHANKFAGRSAVSTWLLGIARHKALTALGVRRIEHLDDEVALNIPDPAPDPERVLAQKDRAALLRRALDALSPEHREIIDLVYDQEKSISEIAELLRIPVNTVKTRMFYARKRLAVLVAGAGAQPAGRQ